MKDSLCSVIFSEWGGGKDPPPNLETTPPPTPDSVYFFLIFYLNLGFAYVYTPQSFAYTPPPPQFQIPRNIPFHSACTLHNAQCFKSHKMSLPQNRILTLFCLGLSVNCFPSLISWQAQLHSLALSLYSYRRGAFTSARSSSGVTGMHS